MQPETNQIPAFLPGDILQNFPEPFYSHASSSLLMQITRAIMTVCDSVLQNSLSQYQLGAFFSQSSASLNGFLTALFDISFNVTPAEAALILQGLQAGFTQEGIEALAKGCLGCGVNVELDGQTLKIAPFSPAPTRRRFLFEWLLNRIKWANVQTVFEPPLGTKETWQFPMGLTGSSQLQTSTENAIAFSITQAEG